jgi:myo-inositol 2-dehydrogenase/D-chiro-inositol 1-dehydrogenase
MHIGLVGAGRIGALHAETLGALDGVDRLIITDVDPDRANRVAAAVGAATADTVEDLFAGGLDGVVIAAPTSAHATLIRLAADSGVPTFCEKPIAPDVAGTRGVLDRVATAGIPLQVGFQRRFDNGFAAARSAAQSGQLGWLHTLRACTSDPAPPHADYIPTSGGIFRDCSVHDFDAVRWVSGREVVTVYATGANRGDDFFPAAGDVDTSVAVLTLDDGTLAVCTATRYNGAGYDVRLEACGSAGTYVAGLDDRAPLTPAMFSDRRANLQPYQGFVERFRDAYVAELSAFLDVVAHGTPSPCPGEEALEALLVAEAADLSRRESRPVTLAEVRGMESSR